MSEIHEERREIVGGEVNREDAQGVAANAPLQQVPALAENAVGSLLEALASHGNQISAQHKQALRELMDALAKQTMGLRSGRYAYALPCGAGKTLSVVALIASAHRLGLRRSFTVAASQIAALGRLRRDLIEAGVPAECIALRHSKTREQLQDLAAEAGDPELLKFLDDTGNEDRPIMLVSHARVRGSASCLVTRHRGSPRNLVIWDETLFVANAQAMTLFEFKSACELITQRLPRTAMASECLRSVATDIDEEIERQRGGESARTLHLLRDVDNEQLAAAVASIPVFGPKQERETLRNAQRLLKMTERPIAVALTHGGGTGDGLIRYSIAVPPELENIAVLDASHQIRLLAQSQCITDGTTAAMRSCKRYEHVQVIEYPMRTGKTTLMLSPTRRESLAAQVANQIRQIPTDEPILIFTFKGDEERSLQRKLKYLISEEGIDLSELLDGRPRISWLTWGSETSLNTFSHCKHVILCGVIRRNLLELAASAAGREDNLAFRLARDQQRRLQCSEMCHCILQAMSRGACRIVDSHGQAKAMTLSIYGTLLGVEEMLRSSLPGVRWHTAQSHADWNANRRREHPDTAASPSPAKHRGQGQRVKAADDSGAGIGA